ncbi:MAG: acyltransferase family protein, partial [Myxococcota bacterium]
EGRGGPVVQRRDFYRRRILRIMPLYTATILVAVALSFEKPGVVIDGVRALFFLNSFTGTVASLVPYSAVWWSLATEIQFYLVLPLLGLCLRSKSGRRIGLGILIVWGIGFAIVASQPELFPGDLRFRLSLSLLGRAPAFLAGIAACWLVLQYGDRIRAAARQNAWLRNGGSDALLLVVLFGLGLVLQQVTSLGFIRAEIAAPASRLAESFLWTMVLLLVLLAPLRSRRLITNGASTMLGRFSYSFYLIHEPILFFGLIRLISLGFPLDVDLILRGGIFAIGFLLCLALSAISYHLIERPFLLRKARIDR